MIEGTDVLCLADAAVFCRLDRNFSALFKKAETRGEVLSLLRLAHAHYAGHFPSGRAVTCYDRWIVATLFIHLLKQKPVTAHFLDRLLNTMEHFALPEFYPCPHGIPDVTQFPGVADLIAAGLLAGDAPDSCPHPTDTAQAAPNPEAKTLAAVLDQSLGDAGDMIAEIDRCQAEMERNFVEQHNAGRGTCYAKTR